MKNLSKLAALSVLAFTAPLSAQEAEKPKMLSPGQIVDQAAPEEWQAIAASDLLVMNLTPDAAGKDRQVIIQLMPAPFSQGWVRNIRKLAKANWWDGTSINRVQDNYVVQWGDPAETEETRKPLPDELEVMTEEDYQLQDIGTSFIPLGISVLIGKDSKRYIESPPPIYNPDSDSYSAETGHSGGWPTSKVNKRVKIAGSNEGVQNPYFPSRQKYRTEKWYAPIHCYGTVGVGRGLTPDTGSGAELYTVIGHAPRHLDRNIAVVGRIVEGMHHLSSMPRGFGPLGFYETPEERVPIKSIRLASELPEAEQPRFEYLSTEGESFAKYAHRRANREPPFFIKPAGGADICNIPVPVRRVKGE